MVRQEKTGFETDPPKTPGSGAVLKGKEFTTFVDISKSVETLCVERIVTI